MVVNIVNDGLPTNNQVFEPNLSQNEGTMESRANQSAMSQNRSAGDSPGFGYNGFYGTGSSSSVNDPYCLGFLGFGTRFLRGLCLHFSHFGTILVPFPYHVHSKALMLEPTLTRT